MATETRTGKCIYCRKAIEQTRIGNYSLWLPKAHEGCAEAKKRKEEEGRAEDERRAVESRRNRANTPEGQLALGIPWKYHGAAFTDFTNLGEVLESFYRGEIALVTLSGPTGTGKTRALYAVFRAAKADGRPCRFCGVLLLAKELQALAGESTRSEMQLLKEISDEAGIVLFDELGAEKETTYIVSALNILIGEREKWDRPTMVATNLTVKEIAEKVDRRIADRLAGGVVLEFRGKSKRLGK